MSELVFVTSQKEEILLLLTVACLVEDYLVPGTVDPNILGVCLWS